MYRVGQLARTAGVNARTIDFYTRIGLLTVAELSPAGYRLYSHEALQRLQWIRDRQTEGHSLAEIRAALERGPAGLTDEVARLETQLEQLSHTIKQWKDAPMDARTKQLLTALALKGMSLAQALLILVNEERFML